MLENFVIKKWFGVTVSIKNSVPFEYRSHHLPSLTTLHIIYIILKQILRYKKKIGFK